MYIANLRSQQKKYKLFLVQPDLHKLWPLSGPTDGDTRVRVRARGTFEMFDQEAMADSDTGGVTGKLLPTAAFLRWCGLDEEGKIRRV